MRTRPYTEAGLARVPCAHCGAPSSEQWHLRPCAIGKWRWFGLCAPCDVKLNGLVLKFVRAADGPALMRQYTQRQQVMSGQGQLTDADAERVVKAYFERAAA